MGKNPLLFNQKLYFCLFFFFFCHTEKFSEVIPGSHSEVTTDSAQEAIWDASNGTWVCCMQE